jgi:hypothetical protein
VTTKKTHVEVKKPEIDVRYLADYMAASERKRRSIVEGCKFRPIARLLQHREARMTIASALRRHEKDPQVLQEKAESIRNKIATDDFDALTNETNADYVKQFSAILARVELPEAEILPGKVFPVIPVNGVNIRFSPDLLLRRTTKTNKLKRGAVMLRYAKGKSLGPTTAGWQSAAILGMLGEHADEDGAEPDKPLCVTVDCQTGETYPALGSAVSMFANMKAACQSISERWPNIPPPEGAVL